jgi:hypothetical protein
MTRKNVCIQYRPSISAPLPMFLSVGGWIHGHTTCEYKELTVFFFVTSPNLRVWQAPYGLPFLITLHGLTVLGGTYLDTSVRIDTHTVGTHCRLWAGCDPVSLLPSVPFWPHVAIPWPSLKSQLSYLSPGGLSGLHLTLNWVPHLCLCNILCAFLSLVYMKMPVLWVPCE